MPTTSIVRFSLFWICYYYSRHLLSGRREREGPWWPNGSAPRLHWRHWQNQTASDAIGISTASRVHRPWSQTRVLLSHASKNSTNNIFVCGSLHRVVKANKGKRLRVCSISTSPFSQTLFLLKSFDSLLISSLMMTPKKFIYNGKY